MQMQDFDAWAALAKSDPEAFEAKRAEVIEAFIQSAPPENQQRLRGVQFRVDMERARASNPLSATIRISNMMWSAFGDLRDALDRSVNGELGGAASAAAAPVRTADVITLPRRSR